jgi:hypothetical protein
MAKAIYVYKLASILFDLKYLGGFYRNRPRNHARPREIITSREPIYFTTTD